MPFEAREIGAEPGASLALDRIASWAWVPAAVALAAIGAFWLLGWHTRHENLALLLTLNAVFVTFAAGVVAVVAARSFLVTGRPDVLLFGSGALLMGLAFVTAPVVGLDDPNDIATIHNLGMLASGALQLGGVVAARRRFGALRAPGFVLAIGYSAVIAFVLFTAQLAAQNLVPTFFVPGRGGTPLRQAVLASAALLLGIAGGLFAFGAGARATFDRLYGSGLLLLSVGLVGVGIQANLGTPISWAGRAAQYVGGTWMALAVAADAFRTRRWALPLRAELQSAKGLLEQFREARDRLALALEGSSDGFWDWNLVTGHVDLDGRLASILGFRPSELPTDASALLAMGHPVEREPTDALLRRVLDGEMDRVELERRARHRDGHWVWLLLRGKVAARDGNGRPARLTGTCTDITTRKAVEEELRASGARLEAVLAGSGAGFVDIDVPTRTVHRSARFWEIAGWPPGSIPADTPSLLHLVHAEDATRVARAQERILSGEADALAEEYRLRSSDGTYRWLHAELRVVARDANHRPLRVAGTVADVTRRVESEIATRESARRLATFVDQMPFAIAMFDPDMRYLAASTAWLRMHRLEGRDVVGRSHYELYPLVPEAWREIHHRCLAGAVVQIEEDRFPLPGGGFEWARWDVRPWHHPSGEIGGIVIFAEVTTARRALQERMAVASRLTAIGTLAAGLAHEINNPLAAEAAGQGLALEVARETRQQLAAGGPFDAAAKVRELDLVVEALEDAQEAGQRIAAIVRDMAAFARPESSRSRVQLRSAVEHALRWIPGPLAAVGDVRIDDRGAPDVQAAAGQLAQVVLNLVTNALKATRPGTRGCVTLRLGTGAAGQATLEVEDQGTGIAPEIRDRIFEPFFTTRPSGEGRGSGLGLAVCHSIVTSHGGTITVTTEVGKGSTFRVELPAIGAGAGGEAAR